MEMLDVKKPILKQPLTISYSFTAADEDRLLRKLRRSEEIGLKLFVLDDDEVQEELQELENYIIDNFIDLDLDIPEEIKRKYIELKNEVAKQS